MPSNARPDWRSDGWRTEALDWIAATAAGHGIRLTGEVEQHHLYPWSTVLHMPTSEGTLFFKATAPETLFEAPLTAALARWFPDCIPEVLGHAAERGWMLMRDAGEPLRAHIRPNKDVSLWHSVISRFARLQIDATARVGELLALRVPDRSPAVLPEAWRRLLEDARLLRIGEPGGVTVEQLGDVYRATPLFARVCAELESAGPAVSINHGDLTDGNVLVRNGRTTFFDWGDACITHPFVSLRNVFVSIEIALDLDDYKFTPTMAAVLESYLEPWTGIASREQLARAFAMSKLAATAVKALAWHATLSPLEENDLATYTHIMPSLIEEFLHYSGELSA